MIVRARPSKTYFYRRFLRDLATVDGDWGADVASSTCKNASFFPTERYLGVDLDINRLSACGSDRSSDRSVAQMDVRRTALEDASFDLVVSTHTLSHLEKEDRPAAARELVRLIKPGGSLILTIPIEGESEWSWLRDFLTERFETVDTVRYKNKISRTYEDLAGDEAGRCTFEGWGPVKTRIGKGLSLVISWLEALPARLGGKGRKGYALAQSKQNRSGASSAVDKGGGFPT